MMHWVGDWAVFGIVAIAIWFLLRTYLEGEKKCSMKMPEQKKNNIVVIARKTGSKKGLEMPAVHFLE